MSKNYRGYGNVMFKMELLGFKDITTARQYKNGTKVFELPIRMYGKHIQVASFKSGYVRRLTIGKSTSDYQLNKRIESEPDYYKVERNGETLYRKFTTRTCELIPNEVDRLEYLVDYCLKNYYIKQANMIEDGKFVPKWKYEFDLENVQKEELEVQVIVNGHRYKVK